MPKSVSDRRDTARRLRKDKERLAAALSEKQKRIALASILAILRDLPQELRETVMGDVSVEFCFHCWRVTGDGLYCHCWNDE